VLLVKADVNKVHLEVSKFEDKALHEDRQLVSFLILVVLILSSAGCDFSELLVSDTRKDGLSDRHYDVKPAFRVKHRAFVSKSR